MSVWNTIKSWFRSEADGAQDWSRDLQRDWSADLDRKESDLRATPTEKLESLQDQISDSSSVFDELRDKIEAASDPEVVGVAEDAAADLGADDLDLDVDAYGDLDAAGDRQASSEDGAD